MGSLTVIKYPRNILQIWYETNQRIVQSKALYWTDSYEIVRVKESSSCSLSKTFADGMLLHLLNQSMYLCHYDALYLVMSSFVRL